MTTCPGAPLVACSAFAGLYSPPDVIVLAVWVCARYVAKTLEPGRTGSCQGLRPTPAQ
jgi:hypothetical protein